MSRTALSIHGITALVVTGSEGRLFVAGSDVAFRVGDVGLHFATPDDFAGFLAKLNEMAAATPAVWAAGARLQVEP